MKISELIIILQAHQNVIGDKNVYIIKEHLDTAIPVFTKIEEHYIEVDVSYEGRDGVQKCLIINTNL